MFNESENIEDLFGKVFRNAEETPPNDLWNNLESSLDDSKVENLYEKSFKNAAEKPSAKVWKKISQALFLQTFFRFNPQTINVYYAALTAVVGVVAYNVTTNEELNTSTQNQVNIEVVKENAPLQVLQQEDKVSAVSVEQTNDYVKQEIPEETPQVIKAVFDVSSNDKASVSNEELRFQSELESVVFHVSKPVVCENVPVEFRLDGVPKDYNITWNFGNKLVESKTFNSAAEAAWSKAGTYSIHALISYKESKAELTHTITVEKATKPVIKGPEKVCEGQKSVAYRVDAKADKSIIYNWDESSFEGNEVNQISEKQARVDWVFSGRDTIFVTKINTVTSCKTEAFFPVKVRSAPTARFTYSPLGDGEFEFIYSGNSKKVTSINWIIEGESLEGDMVIVSSNGIGRSIVTLEVTDKHKCVSKIQKEISFYDYIIKVPETFTPSEEYDARQFLPLTNTPLKEFKIEVFDASSVLIWESTSIVDGKPAEGWNGSVKGNLAPEGKYQWKITAVFKDGVKYKGVPQPNGECKPSKLFLIKY